MQEVPMTTSGSNAGKSETAQPSMRAIYAAQDKKKRTMILLGMIAALAVISLVILFQYWHPLWRYQYGYVSEAQFGQDWPFTVPEAKVICLGPNMLLETRAGIFALTSQAVTVGYKSLESSNIWKYDPNGWKQRVSADKFWTYVNTLCK
jgi:hypothetical protein